MNLKTVNMSKMIHSYLSIMFIYITFETVILNFVSDIFAFMLPIIRYGIELFGYLLIVVCVMSRRCIKIKLNPFDWLIIGTIVIVFLSSLINAVNFRIFLIGFRYLLRYLYIYVLIRLANWNEIHYNKIFKLLRVIMLIEILLVVWEILHRSSADLILFPHFGNIVTGFSSIINTEKSRWAIYGSLGRYNLFGYFCVMAIWYWIAEHEVEKDKKSMGMILVWSLLLIISFSRQTIVGIFGTYMMFLTAKKRINWKQLFIIIGLFLTIIVLIISAASFVIGDDYTSTGIGVVTGSIYDRYVSMFSVRFLQIDYEGYGRTWFLSEGIRRLVSVKPLLGFGLGMYGCPDTVAMADQVYKSLNIPTTYYMDVYLGCLIGQIGLIGTGIYLMSYFFVMKKAKYVFNRSREKKTVKLSIITFGTVGSTILMMFFSSSLCNRVMAYYMWLFIGLFIVSIYSNSDLVKKTKGL